MELKSRVASSEAHPIMRGFIGRLTRWADDPDRPGWERRKGVLDIDCSVCGGLHSHFWDLADGPDIATARYPHCSSRTPERRPYYISVVPDSVDVRPHKLKLHGLNCHIAPPGVPVIRPKPKSVT